MVDFYWLLLVGSRIENKIRTNGNARCRDVLHRLSGAIVRTESVAQISAFKAQFYDVAAKINTTIVNARCEQGFGLAQSKWREFLQFLRVAIYFNPANLPRPRILSFARLPYCFIIRRMSAYCFRT
jgi:hypothetical protein